MTKAGAGRAVRAIIVLASLALAFDASAASARDCPEPKRSFEASTPCTIIADVGGDLEMDAAGNIFVVDHVTDKLFKVAADSEGTYSTTPVTFDNRKSEPISGLRNAIGIGPEGILYLADDHGIFRALPLPDGSFRTEDLLDPTVPAHRALNVEGIAVHQNGNIAFGHNAGNRGYYYEAVPPASGSATPYYSLRVRADLGSTCAALAIAFSPDGAFANTTCNDKGVYVEGPTGRWSDYRFSGPNYRAVAFDNLGNAHVVQPAYDEVFAVARTPQGYFPTGSKVRIDMPISALGDPDGSAYVVTERGGAEGNQYVPTGASIAKFSPYVAVASDRTEINVGETVNVSVAGLNAFGMLDPAFESTGTLTGPGLEPVPMAPFVDGVSTTAVTLDRPYKALAITANVAGMPQNSTVKPVTVTGPFAGFGVTTLPGGANTSVLFVAAQDAAGNPVPAYKGTAEVTIEHGGSLESFGTQDPALAQNTFRFDTDASTFGDGKVAKVVHPGPVRDETITVTDVESGVSSTSEPFNVYGELVKFTISVNTAVVGKPLRVKIIALDAIGQALGTLGNDSKRKITWSDKSGQLSGRPRPFEKSNGGVPLSVNMVTFDRPFTGNRITVTDSKTDVASTSRSFNILQPVSSRRCKRKGARRRGCRKHGGRDRQRNR